MMPSIARFATQSRSVTYLRKTLLAAALCVSFPCSLLAQEPASAAAPSPNWQRFEAAPKRLPPHTKVHVAGDRMSKKCLLESVTDEALVCSKGHTQYTFPRAEVRSVKLTRPLRSTLVGMGIGLGAGLGVGALVGHVEDPSMPNQFLDFSGLGRAAITAAGGVIGFIGGGVVGGTTDFLRGPTLYIRTATQASKSQP